MIIEDKDLEEGDTRPSEIVFDRLMTIIVHGKEFKWKFKARSCQICGTECRPAYFSVNGRPYTLQNPYNFARGKYCGKKCVSIARKRAIENKKNHSFTVPLDALGALEEKFMFGRITHA